MRSTVAWCIGVASALVFLSSTAPADAPTGAAAKTDPEAGWKSARNSEGERIRWHSCTVTYTIAEGSASQRRAIDAAVEDAEDASGLDFREVPQERADLRFDVSDEDGGVKVASTGPWLLGDEYTEATILVYSNALDYPFDARVDNYRHEIGHALGLDHIEGKDTMNSTVIRNPTQDGWRAGLDWLYQDCR